MKCTYLVLIIENFEVLVNLSDLWEQKNPNLYFIRKEVLSRIG